jgi:hypothetical protein
MCSRSSLLDHVMPRLAHDASDASLRPPPPYSSTPWVDPECMYSPFTVYSATVVTTTVKGEMRVAKLLVKYFKRDRF